MAAKTCPSCQLVHRATATRCECGYDFEEEQQTKSKAGHRREALPWHQEPIVAVAALVVFWPGGLILLSQNKQLSGRSKTIIVVCWLALLLGLLAYKMSGNAPSTPPVE